MSVFARYRVLSYANGTKRVQSLVVKSVWFFASFGPVKGVYGDCLRRLWAPVWCLFGAVFSARLEPLSGLIKTVILAVYEVGWILASAGFSGVFGGAKTPVLRVLKPLRVDSGGFAIWYLKRGPFMPVVFTFQIGTLNRSGPEGCDFPNFREIDSGGFAIWYLKRGPFMPVVFTFSDRDFEPFGSRGLRFSEFS